MFLSPYITSKELPIVVNALLDIGITILDIQRIDYTKLQYDNGDFSTFNKDNCFFKVRGTTFNFKVGFILKLAREDLSF